MVFKGAGFDSSVGQSVSRIVPWGKTQERRKHMAAKKARKAKKATKGLRKPKKLVATKSLHNKGGWR